MVYGCKDLAWASWTAWSARLSLLLIIAADALDCDVDCSTYGTCYQDTGRCDCPKDRQGPDCSQQLAEIELLARAKAHGSKGVADFLSDRQGCLNNCSYPAGTCVSGWCHCMAGFFGMDCALSLGEDGRPCLLAHESVPYATRAKRPWVYVYDLPGSMSTWNSLHRLDRPLYLHFYQRLLGSGARVADGDLADWYFIPVRQRTHSDEHYFEAALQYVRTQFPWFNRTSGHRHFVIHTGDWGRAETAPKVRRLGTNLTWLTHWGLTKERKKLGWFKAHRMELDVVIPVAISPGHFKKFGMDASPLHPLHAEALAEARPEQREQEREQDEAPAPPPLPPTTLFFAGRICYDQKPPDNGAWPNCRADALFYSAGVRQKVHYHHWNRTGYHIVPAEPRYGDYMTTARYCLAPPGGGHGQRQIQAVFVGCVPVSIGDNILEPFEPMYSWSDFGVRVPEADIPRLHEVLDAIGPEEYERKRAGLRCAAQHLAYSSVTGGFLGEDGRWDAFETALEVMRVMAEHPGAPPDQYRKLDAAFDDFMACRTEPRSTRGAGARKGGTRAEAAGEASDQAGGVAAICSHSRYDAERDASLSCRVALHGIGGGFGPPGGVMCAKYSQRLASCPRPWL